jgi:AcrR family transcriptional regulator
VARRRRANTRARLVEAALGVFAEKGVKRVTVDDLVGAAGFTRGAFYSNFSSIEEVFFAVFEEQSRAMIESVRSRIDSVPDREFSLESLGPILEGLLPLSRTWYLIQTEFTLLALRSDQARRVFAEHHQMFRGEMVELLGDVVARLGREPAVPLEQLTETAIGLYLHSLAHESLGTGSLDTRTLVESVLPRVLVGLSNPT